ncbi:MAG TPA: tetratricopeptide repeat protein [Planctomycetaceae bacterium]|nr:tetratricopeptide repeat protein [Planctomycetaceae bacterium]
MLTTRRILWLSLAVVLVAAAAGGGLVFGLFRGPPSPDETFRSALAALERGDLDAVAEAAQTLEGDPRYSSHVRLLDGGILFRMGKLPDALAHFAALPAEGELREPVLLLTGESLYHLKRLTEAESWLRQLAHEQPDHAHARRLLAALYYDLGATDAAKIELTELIRLAPDDYSPHRLLGLMYFDFGHNASAIEHYRQALKRSPPRRVQQEIIHELARALISERQYAEALEHLRDAQDDATVLALRAECYWSLGRSDEARECLRQAGELGAGNRYFALLQARVALDEGRPRDALAPLERALAADPHDAECRYQFALAWRQLGDRQRADAEMVLWEQADALHKRLTELNLKAIAEPRNAEVRDQLAEACLALGKDKLAAVWRESARACREAQAFGVTDQ